MSRKFIAFANIFFVKAVFDKSFDLNRYRLIHFITYDRSNLLSLHSYCFHNSFYRLFLVLVFCFTNNGHDARDIGFGLL